MCYVGSSYWGRGVHRCGGQGGPTLIHRKFHSEENTIEATDAFKSYEVDALYNVQMQDMQDIAFDIAFPFP